MAAGRALLANDRTARQHGRAKFRDHLGTQSSQPAGSVALRITEYCQLMKLLRCGIRAMPAAFKE